MANLGYDAYDRLGANLEEIGGSPTESRWHRDKPSNVGSYSPRQMMIAPAGVDVWGYSADVRFIRAAALTFNMARLGAHLEIDLPRYVMAPRLRFTDDRIWTLVKLLSDTVGEPDPSAQLYGDGLIAALTARLLDLPEESERKPAGLAPWQLKRVLDYLEEELPQRVALAELATLAGLSQSHFSRAFRAATGMAPYQWQLNARIRRAQGLLLDTHASLDEIAAASGFADAVHFSRTFRKFTGASPAGWRRDRRI